MCTWALPHRGTPYTHRPPCTPRDSYTVCIRGGVQGIRGCTGGCVYGCTCGTGHLCTAVLNLLHRFTPFPVLRRYCFYAVTAFTPTSFTRSKRPEPIKIGYRKALYTVYTVLRTVLHRVTRETVLHRFTFYVILVQAVRAVLRGFTANREE